MELAAKLQIKPGAVVAVLDAPEGYGLVLPAGCTMAADPAAADVVVAFVRERADLDRPAQPALDAGRADRLSWLAYPKARALGTDLNRDVLREILLQRGVQPVRQVALDETWSALRVRPA